MAESARDLALKWLQNDPRKVHDDYKPDGLQLSRSNSEAQLFDDDGNVLNSAGIANILTSGDAASDSDDELQLQAILKCSGMPQPEDGGISDEDVVKAAAVPLPLDEQQTSWKDRVPNPMNLRVPLKGVSIPTVQLPAMPTVSFQGWNRWSKAKVAEDKATSAEEATSAEDVPKLSEEKEIESKKEA